MIFIFHESPSFGRGSSAEGFGDEAGDGFEEEDVVGEVKEDVGGDAADACAYV